MTQRQLHRQVARITGEPLATITGRGFGVMSLNPLDRDPGDLGLAVECPSCGRPVPYPGPAGDGSPAMAECDRCDVYFAFEPRKVRIVASPPGTRSPGGTAWQ